MHRWRALTGLYRLAISLIFKRSIHEWSGQKRYAICSPEDDLFRNEAEIFWNGRYYWGEQILQVVAQNNLLAHQRLPSQIMLPLFHALTFYLRLSIPFNSWFFVARRLMVLSISLTGYFNLHPLNSSLHKRFRPRGHLIDVLCNYPSTAVNKPDLIS